MTADNTAPLTRSELIDCRAWIEQHNRPVESWTVREMLEFVAAARSVVPRLCAEWERLVSDLSSAEVTISNLQSALVAAGHDADCPVVHGASMDCVPGTCKVDRQRVALLVYADKANWGCVEDDGLQYAEGNVWLGRQAGPDLAREALKLDKEASE